MYLIKILTFSYFPPTMPYTWLTCTLSPMLLLTLYITAFPLLEIISSQLPYQSSVRLSLSGVNLTCNIINKNSMSRSLDHTSLKSEPNLRESKNVLPKLGQEFVSLKDSSIRKSNPLVECIESAKFKRWKVNKLYKDSYKHVRPRRHTENSQISVSLRDEKVEKNGEKEGGKLFCTGSSEKSAVEEGSPESRTNELNKAIEKSKNFVSLIRTNRQKLTKLRINYLRTYEDEPQSPKEIYNYLERRLVVSKDKEIDKDIINRFVGHSPPKKLLGVEQRSRKFLLDKMRNDFCNYTDVESYRKEHLRSMIMEELDDRKQQYSRDYRKRYNIPYFSYLSLSNSEKQNVLTRKARKSFI